MSGGAFLTSELRLKAVASAPPVAITYEVKSCLGKSMAMSVCEWRAVHYDDGIGLSPLRFV